MRTALAAALGIAEHEAGVLIILAPLLLIPLAVPFAFISHATWTGIIRRHGPRGARTEAKR